MKHGSKTLNNRTLNTRDRQKLLAELESIQSLLLIEEDTDNIPVLKEKVPEQKVLQEEAPAADVPATGNADVVIDPENSSASAGQSLLSGKTFLLREESADKKPANLAENPFLPQGIRQRLKSGPTLSQKSHSPLSVSDQDEIINALVKELMPTIETRLRQKLKETMKRITSGAK